VGDGRNVLVIGIPGDPIRVEESVTVAGLEVVDGILGLSVFRPLGQGSLSGESL
jgi:hypothetical protein